jgi:hypothetical protein
VLFHWFSFCLFSKLSFVLQIARVWLSLSPSASIITYRPSPWDVLWPRRGVRTAERIVNSLPQDSRVIVHGFSTGGYLYGLMSQSFVAAVRSNRCEVSGCVFDCAVDMEGIADGMANAISKNNIGRAVFRAITSCYLFLTRSFIAHLYSRASDSFKNPPVELKVPVCSFCDRFSLLTLMFLIQILVLAGGCDLIASTSTQEKVVLAWKSQGIRCSIKVIDGANHCQLFVHNPQIYVAELRSFLSQINPTDLK